MSDETVCEVCGREHGHMNDEGGRICARRAQESFGATVTSSCYRLGYTRERTAREAAEKERNEALAVVELAAKLDCKFRWADDSCEAEDCLHCRAAKLLPELRCKCGKWVLDRSSPSIFERPDYHQPGACAPPPSQTHCSSCNRPLPKADVASITPVVTGAIDEQGGT